VTQGELQATGDEPTPEPAVMLALLEEQQRKVDAAMVSPVPWLYGIWGTAWLVGFLMLWSAWPGGNPWMRVPALVAGGVFAVLTLGAILSSAVIGMRINRGVRGTSDFQGAVYGASWSLCGCAFAALGGGLIANGMSWELASVYYPSAYGLMVGTLYLGGAALWRDKGQLVIGIALLVVASVAPFFGQPANNLVMAVAGGGTFLVGAAVVRAQLHRER